MNTVMMLITIIPNHDASSGGVTLLWALRLARGAVRSASGREEIRDSGDVSCVADFAISKFNPAYTEAARCRAGSVECALGLYGFTGTGYRLVGFMLRYDTTTHSTLCDSDCVSV